MPNFQTLKVRFTRGTRAAVVNADGERETVTVKPGDILDVIEDAAIYCCRLGRCEIYVGEVQREKPIAKPTPAVEKKSDQNRGRKTKRDN